MNLLPNHLQKYIVKQDYEKYTSVDHAVWRYILRQLKFFLSTHAHESYLDGLIKTGIDIEQIPRIENISAHLENFGWRALPVSGFIPPAAFMELQSLSVLPIASDMRSIEHLLYTPAPDIVHEAAGHAPIIANPEYAAYLKEYAQVAKKAIMSKEDLELYKAIRELSDIKENPASTKEEIEAAEKKLVSVSKSISYVSEASELSRMNWWTAEYGLIGNTDSPKIFGAGLLSSVGESKWCLSDKVKKIPLSLACIKQSYDITEPQPQLFVAESFSHLSKVLNELAQTMSFSIGGKYGLDHAIKAESVNTVELNNGLQISGVLKNYICDQFSDPAYLQFQGPTQICFNSKEVEGQGTKCHSVGYGTPIGKMKNFAVENLKIHSSLVLEYASGVKVSGQLTKITRASSDAIILTFKNATAEISGKILFDPSWGDYDIVIGEKVSSVYGGPADRIAYGEIEDFVAPRVPQAKYSDIQIQRFSYYQKVRDARNNQNLSAQDIKKLYYEMLQKAHNEWLLFLELFELAIKHNADSAFQNEITKHLTSLSAKNKLHEELITEGLKLAHAKF